jgi:hypothetical protein
MPARLSPSPSTARQIELAVARANSDSGSLRLLAARSRHTPPQVLQALFESGGGGSRADIHQSWGYQQQIAGAALQNPNMPHSVLAEQIRAYTNGGLPNSRGIHVVLANPSLTVADITAVLTRARLALQPTRSNIPTRHARQTVLIAYRALRHPKTSAALLRQWAELDVEWHTHLSAIATHPACPPDVQLVLARHPRAMVRSRLASNPNLTADARDILRADSAAGVRTALIRHGHADAAMLAASATHRSAWVRSAVAEKSSQPEVLEQLAFDARPTVRRKVSRNEAATDVARVIVGLHQ